MEPKNDKITIELGGRSEKGVTLKELAKEVGLTPGTVSVVLNNTNRAKTIPQNTKDRIWQAARDLGYRPHYFARSLRANRSFTVGVLTSELSESYHAMVLSGIEAALVKHGYFYLTTSHLHRKELLQHNIQMLVERQVEGIITIDTPVCFELDLPIVAVAGHEEIDGVTNVILNHQTAADLAIAYLKELGHSRIAIIKGQEFSADTHIRFDAIVRAANGNGIHIDDRNIVQLEGMNPSPDVGRIAVDTLLARGDRDFTALFAFNDMSAIGAMRALADAGIRVPEDVSVIGFDDIYFAAFNSPSLTTIRQPLYEMGELAAQTLLKTLSRSTDGERPPSNLMVEPELVVRESTGRRPS